MSDSRPPRGTATYDDVLNAPEGLVAQLVDGLLETQARPAGAHAQAHFALGVSVENRFGRGRGGTGRWVFLSEPEIHLGPDVLVPDLAGWRVERMPHVADDPYITLAPDWVCEVLSPSTVRIDRVAKMRIYHRESVAHMWLVDPRVRSLEVYRREAEGWMLVSTADGPVSVHAEPFASEAIELDLLWLPEDAAPPSPLSP